MTQNDYKSQIAAQVANSAVNQLIAELAAKCVEVDELKSQIALYEKLQPTPRPEAGHSP
jgi:hypothetical protein